MCHHLFQRKAVQRKLADEQGMTFVELLIVGLIVALVINGMAFALATSGKNVWLRTDSRMTSLSAAQRALNRLSEDLHRASQATLNCSTANTVTFTPVGAADPVTYTLNSANNTLTRTDTLGTQVVAGYIRAFAPACQPNNPLVQLQLTARVPMVQNTFLDQPLATQVRVVSP